MSRLTSYTLKQIGDFAKQVTKKAESAYSRSLQQTKHSNPDRLSKRVSSDSNPVDSMPHINPHVIDPKEVVERLKHQPNKKLSLCPSSIYFNGFNIESIIDHEDVVDPSKIVADLEKSIESKKIT